MSTKNLTDQRYELAEMISCPAEHLSQIKENSGYLFFSDSRNSAVEWSVKLTSSGRIKKNSLRHG